LFRYSLFPCCSSIRQSSATACNCFLPEEHYLPPNVPWFSFLPVRIIMLPIQELELALTGLVGAKFRKKGYKGNIL
jgi:hypothetical protein